MSVYSRRASDGGGLIKLTDAGTRNDHPVKASPDGSKLLFYRPHAKGETCDCAPMDVFVVGADGSGLTRLSPLSMTTAVVFSEDAVSWSPDGTRIVFDRVSHDPAAGDLFPQTVQIMIVDVATGAESAIGQPEIVAGRGDPRRSWSWSPDGRSLLVQASPGSRPLTIDIGTGEATELPWDADSAPSWQRIAAD